MTKLPHAAYTRAITSLLEAKQILIDAQQYKTALPLSKFIDKFIKANV